MTSKTTSPNEPPALPLSVASWRGEAALWAALTGAVMLAVALDVPAWLRGPAPYPPEWQWVRRATRPNEPWLPVLLAGLSVLTLLGLTGTRGAARRPRRAALLILAAAIPVGWAFQLALLAPEPDGALRTVFSQTVYRTATSYFTVAASPEARDPVEFLRRHHELLPAFRKGAKHASTHPPGAVLFYRGLIALAEAFPRAAAATWRAAGFPDTNPLRARPQYSPADRAAALVGGLLLGLLGAAACWPIYALARTLGCGPLAASRLGVLWTVVPGPALMLPQLDQALALPVAGATALLVASVARGEVLRALAAGALGGVAVFLSYGAAAFLAVSGLGALALAATRPPGLRRGAQMCAVAASVTALLFTLPAAIGHRPFRSLAVALGIHRDYFTLPRDYALWLVFNLVDLALFVGLPVAVAFAARTVSAAVDSASALDPGPAGSFRVGLAAGLLLLVVSGQARGEVGRIWIPLMPALLLGGLAGPARWKGAPERPAAAEAVVCGVLLIALCVTLRAFWHLP